MYGSWLVIFIWLTTSLALARPDPVQPKADEAFAAGANAYRHGDYDVAISAWKEAYALAPEPRILFDLAQAYERQGNLSEALRSFEQFMEQTPRSEPGYQEANSHVAVLRQRIALTGLILQGGREGGHITIDGVDMGRTPRPDRIPLSPGPHEVLIRWPDLSEFNAHVVLSVAQSLEVPVRDAAPRPPVMMDRPARVELKPREAAREVEPNRQRVWRWIIPGASVVAAGVALMGYGAARQHTLGECDTSYCTSDEQQRVEAQRTTGFAVGSALLAGGATLLTLGLLGRSEQQPRAAACGVGPARVHCILSF